MRTARILGGIGRVLIWTGSIVLLFVAYQLWGTNIAEARAQGELEDEFNALVEEAGVRAPTTTVVDESPTTTSPRTTTTTSTTLPPPPPDDGQAVARIVIPDIGVDKIVVEGVGRSDLRKGPGHYPDTPLPGQPGNSAIAGHRTTYGAPFNRVNELEPGDTVFVTTLQGVFEYEVIGTEIVAPSAVEVVEDKGDDRLTLTSCHPEYSARQRIVVSALLVDEPAPVPTTTTTAPELDELPTEDVSGDQIDDAATADDDADADAPLDSLDGEDERTAAPAVRWGAVTAGVWLAFYLLSRRWRRWPAYLLGAPVFGVTLFIFFGALSETLPSNF